MRRHLLRQCGHVSGGGWLGWVRIACLMAGKVGCGGGLGLLFLRSAKVMVGYTPSAAVARFSPKR